MAKFAATDYAVSINGTQFGTSLNSAELTIEADDLETTAFGGTFRTRVGGLKSASVTLNFMQDFAAASLWNTLFTTPGASLSLTFAPHGNAVPSTTQPHFTATGYAETVPDMGGAAGEYFTYDLTIKLDDKPTKVTAGA